MMMIMRIVAVIAAVALALAGPALAAEQKASAVPLKPQPVGAACQEVRLCTKEFAA